MPPKINNGDTAFVKRQFSLDVGDMCIFIYNNEAFCKQFTAHTTTVIIKLYKTMVRVG